MGALSIRPTRRDRVWRARGRAPGRLRVVTNGGDLGSSAPVGQGDSPERRSWLASQNIEGEIRGRKRSSSSRRSSAASRAVRPPASSFADIPTAGSIAAQSIGSLVAERPAIPHAPAARKLPHGSLTRLRAVP